MDRMNPTRRKFRKVFVRKNTSVLTTSLFKVLQCIASDFLTTLSVSQFQQVADLTNHYFHIARTSIAERNKRRETPLILVSEAIGSSDVVTAQLAQ